MKQYRNKILLIVLVGILLLINLPFHAILQTASMGGDAEQAVTQLFEKNATATDTDADRATPMGRLQKIPTEQPWKMQMR